MSASRPIYPPDLEYPPAQVDEWLAGLDLNTLIMPSNPDIASHEVNPLEESTYAVLSLSDTLTEPSDDEGVTASIASTPDNVSTFDDDDDNDDDFGQDTEHHEQTIPEAPEDEAQPVGHDSVLTEIPSMVGSRDSRVIQLEEDTNTKEGATTARAVIKEFREDQLSDVILSRYGRSNLRLSAQASLSDRCLPVPAGRPFNVLYIGNVEQWHQTDIDACVGAALDASPGPSRSIMIRGQMETCGPDVLPWHCSRMTLQQNQSRKVEVTMTLHNGTMLKLTDRQILHSTHTSCIPDLVVFWYPHSIIPAPETENYPVALELLRLNQIPCLQIAAGWRFHLHPHTFDGHASQSLRVCVEGRDEKEAEFEQQESIPIDLYTFMNLDPSQLNRHLAAQAPPSGSAKTTKSAPAKLFDWVMSSTKSKEFGLNRQSPKTKKVLLAFAALVSILGAYVLGAAFMPQLYVSSIVPSVPGSLPSEPFDISSLASSSTTASATPTSQGVTSLTPTSSSKFTMGDLTVIPSLGKSGKPKKETKKPEKVAGFEIQTTGDHQFVLSPSQHFTSRKRKPQLQIQVLQEAKAVPIQYVRTVDGSYVVDLEQEYSLGWFNVSIATHSKPLMQQTFSVTLGHNKSVLVRFMDTIKKDVTTVQQEIRGLTSSISKRLHTELAVVDDCTSAWKAKIIDSKKDVKTRVKRQIAVGAQYLNNVTGETWMVLRKATAPVRTHEATLRARNNSLRLRCRVERIVGLSSRKDDRKKTWACKKIGL